MKTLSITITRCRLCPIRLRVQNAARGGNYCRRAEQDNHLRQIGDDELDTIPKWCPLPDAEEAEVKHES